jgi:hypothetical protein
MFVFDAHAPAIIGGMAAIFDISWRRTKEHNRIRWNYSIKKGGKIPSNTR